MTTSAEPVESVANSPGPRLSLDAFDLLGELRRNNTREWFRTNRPAFDEHLTQPFVEILEHVSSVLSGTAWPVKGGRATLFRQLRDQRYAKAQPYATSVRGLLTSSGRKPVAEGCVHVEVAADGGFVGVGFHRPPADVLRPIRQRMLDEPAQWRRVVQTVEDAGLRLAEDRLVRMPRGFAPVAEHEMAADLRLRSLEYVVPMAVSDWTAGDVVATITAAVRPGLELLRFGNTA